MRLLVMNADDFGSTETTNAAILRAHREGVLTSTSLMVNESAAASAVELARQVPSLAVGLHLALSCGPASRESEIAPDGRFIEDPAAAGIRFFFLPAARRAVRKEIEEQFRRFAATGLEWSHIDGHQHLHMHPVAWDSLVQQCEAYGIRRVRIPNEEWKPRSRERIAGRRMEWLFFQALRKRSIRMLAGRGFTVMDRVYGHLETGRVSSEYLMEVVDRIAHPLTEIYSHPGTRHAQPLASDAAMDMELAALLDPRVRDRIEQRGIVLTTYVGAEAHLNQQPTATPRLG